MCFHVEYLDTRGCRKTFLWIRPGEDDGVTIGGPTGIGLAQFPGQHFGRATTARRNQVDLLRLAIPRAIEEDVVSIRRPARQMHGEWGKGELLLLRAIDLAAPQGSVWVT